MATALFGIFANGFIAASIHQTEIFALAVLLGTIAWVLLATRIAMPVSTTHASTESLVVMSAVALGAGNITWSTLLHKVALLLAASPFVALALALAACF